MASAIDIPTEDGTTLAGWWHEPDAPAIGAAIIAPGMAIPARYYDPFAGWLSSHRIATLRFDYRGFGGSLAGRMKDVTADAEQWMDDVRDALRYLAGHDHELPLTWIGHSFGGQALPFVDHRELDKVVHVAVGSGYWGPQPQARARAAAWKYLVPAATRVFGYFPGNALRIVGDLPPNVMRQWARWALNPDYVVGARDAADLFAKVSTPIASISFTDDEMLPSRSIDDLHKWFTGSTVLNLRFTPAQLGVERIGHLGFFRAENQPLWDELVLPHVATAPEAAAQCTPRGSWLH